MDKTLKMRSSVTVMTGMAVAMVIRKNLWHEPRVNRESDGWSHPPGFLRQTAEDKMKVSLSGFQMRFGGLAGKKRSSHKLDSVKVIGWVKTAFKMIEAPSFR